MFASLNKQVHTDNNHHYQYAEALRQKNGFPWHIHCHTPSQLEAKLSMSYQREPKILAHHSKCITGKPGAGSTHDRCHHAGLAKMHLKEYYQTASPKLAGARILDPNRLPLHHGGQI